MSRPIRAYLAGPVHGSGTQANNVRQAIEAADMLRKAGFVPFVPHLFVLWEMQFPGTEQGWILDMCKEWVRACDIFVRIDGKSPGADIEEAFAVELGKPVFKKTEQYVGNVFTGVMQAIAAKAGGKLSHIGLDDTARYRAVQKHPLQRLQEEVALWLEKQPWTPAPHHGLLGLQEEVGELAHAHLKMEHGIRGTREELKDRKFDAIGDIVVFLAGYCESNDLDLASCVELTWREVQKRDWKSNPANGQVDLLKTPFYTPEIRISDVIKGEVHGGEFVTPGPYSGTSVVKKEDNGGT